MRISITILNVGLVVLLSLLVIIKNSHVSNYFSINLFKNIASLVWFVKNLLTPIALLISLDYNRAYKIILNAQMYSWLYRIQYFKMYTWGWSDALSLLYFDLIFARECARHNRYLERFRYVPSK